MDQPHRYLKVNRKCKDEIKKKQRGEQGTGEAAKHYKSLKSESSFANKEQNPSSEPDKLDSVQMLRYF